MIKSKLELRPEAAKLTLLFPETSIDNFHERAYRMETYLLGDAELPETYSESGELKESIDNMLSGVFETLAEAHRSGANGYSCRMEGFEPTCGESPQEDISPTAEK